MKRQTAARLYEKKRPPSRLSHAVKTAPLNNLSAAAHREIDKYADDNVALEAAEHAESGAESAARLADSAMRSRQLRQHRKAETAESKPEPSASNPISRRQQRKAIRNQYAAASSGRDAETAEKTAEKFREAAVKAAEFVRRHKKGFLIAGGVGLVLLFMLNVFSSCSVILESMGSSVAASTYPSGDEDMLGAEAAYCEMEAALEAYLEDYEETHEYDEYKYTLDSIEHDPYVLISILTALRGGEWTLEGVEKTLSEIFEKQYVLTEDATTEERTRTEIRTGTRKVKDPATGEEKEETYEYEEEVTYEVSVCSVTLSNFNLSHLPVYIMSESQLSSYAIYMVTLGNRPDLFPDSPYVNRYSKGYTDYDIPPEVLEDEQFAAIIREAEKYLGYPYVWGGSSPSTSFDCSGFVSWVINHSGWNVGRLGADGLYSICTPVEVARPGDLVFFSGTYDTPGMSHVGIYVGNHTMIHCGDPISYTNLNSAYWQEHFAGYGRLPQEGREPLESEDHEAP